MPETTGNLLLNSLPHALQRMLLCYLKPVSLPVRTILHEQNEMPTYVHFLTSGVAAVVMSMPEGGSAEVGLIGREGAVGLAHLLGPIPAPAQCFMQMAGTGYRIRLSDLRQLFLHETELQQRVLEFTQLQIIILEQLAACNKLHEAEARLARWLLMCRERSEDDTLLITQEFIAEMLGTRRTTVTLVAGNLQRRRMIDYRRGRITILNRGELENVACACYPFARDALHRLYAPC